MTKEIEELEARGFYQETYRLLDKRFSDWNYGVWQHRWHLSKGVPCALCGSPGPSVRVNQMAFCMTCLNEYPHVSWHPTGAVRPKFHVFLQHAALCDQH